MNTHPTGTSSHLTAVLACSKASLIQCSISPSVNSPSCCMPVVIFIKESQKSMSFWVQLGSAVVLVGSGVCNISERVDMQLESNSESKQGMDSVAQALMNIFSNDAEISEDHSLSMFLLKVYKNNLSQKPKRMNSIRLTRFNAFLYRLHSNYPSSPNANTLLHHALLAVLTNDRNFQEEEDEQIVLSIGRWACHLVLDTITRGFYDSAYTFLKYLIDGDRPALLPLAAFEEMLRNEPYFCQMELSSEDERVALRGQSNFSITGALSLHEFILSQLDLHQIYLNLYQNAADKRQIVRLFNRHMAKSSPDNPADLFQQVFLSRPLSSASQIESVFQALEESYFSQQATVRILQLVIRQQQKVSIFMELALKDNAIDSMFLQLLSKHWRIEQLVDEFLAAKKIKNTAILFLILNSENPIPKKYMLMPFNERDLKYQHAIVFALALTQHNSKTMPGQLIELLARVEDKLPKERKALIFRAIHYSLAAFEKKALYSNIINLPLLANFNGTPTLDFLPMGECKSDRANAQDKKRLLKMLESYSEGGDNAMKIKAQLLGVCNVVSATTKRIKQLNQLMQRPFEDILRHVTEEAIKRDPQLVAALLMAANNKLFLTFFPQPRTEIVEVLVSLYLEYHNSFAKSIGRLENEDRNSHKSQYYAAIFRLGLHLKRKFGTLAGDLGAILNGETNYKRVNGVDFAEYFIGEEQKRGLVGQLWVGKKIAFELRKLLENVVNLNASNSENRRQLKGLFESDWESPLAFEAIRTYIQAGIQDPQVLVELLALLQPSYTFMEKVERTFNQQLDDYTDILYYTPELLREVYPEMLAFLAQLVDSQPVKREKDKDRERRKSSKKKKGDREKQERRAIASDVYNNADHILDNNALFECLMKRRELKTLFGDADLLPNFSPLTAILLKINDQFNRLERIANEWLPSLRIFHCQKPQAFQQWSLKVMSYCQLWQVFLVKKGFKFPPEELQRHFHILTEFLNVLYESKRQLPQFQEKILITLLLIYQASRGGSVQQAQVPAQALKNFFLGYRLPTPNEQHYYLCFTCNLPICQVCLPFLHKHHDINYLGKDGYCVHDNNKRGKEDDKQQQQQQQLLQQQLSREQRLRQLERYSVGPPPGSNIFQAPAYHPALMRNQRREEDWLMSSFEFPDEEMDFGEHLRFKEIMEMRMKDQRERERDRDREKDSLFSRERERMERDREDILLMFEKEKNQNNPNGNGSGNKEDLAQIRSSSCKSIRNLHYSHPNRQYFVPEFTPTPEPQGNYPQPIDTRPLRCLLLRELRAQGAQESERTVQGKTTVSLLNERYNFFNKSNYFKSGGRPDFGMMRGMGLAGMGSARRSLLTSNNRFLAYPTPNNGVILMVLANILAKMTKRIQTRSMADFQQERGFLAASINNSNFSFEPLQIQFNRHSPNLLAIIGLNQLGFAQLTNEGKLQKYSDSDFKSNEPITKFVWLSRHRNIFAVANGNSIRLGHVNDEGRVKTTNRFRVHIEKTIRDFQINSESGSLFVYILDHQGGLYRAEFDYRGSKTLNITDKKLNYPQNLEQLQSLIFVDKKLLLTSGTGKCYLLQVQGKTAPPTYLQTFDFESALKAHENTKFIKWPVFASQLQVVQSSEHLFSVGCLLKRASGDPKRRGGYLFIIRGGSKQNLEVIMLHEEETIESYEVTEMSENSFLITAIDQNGSVFCFNYHIPPELFSLREDTKIPIDDNSIQLCNTLVRTNNLLALARYCEPKRYQNFKESKDLTGAYKVVIDSTTSIKATTNDPFKFFWTGVLFTAEPKGQQSQLVFDIFGRHYAFQINKPREIQIPFNIKQTMEIFTADGDFAIHFQKSGVDVKNFRIHGIEYSVESIYKRAFIHLHKLVITHLAFSANNLQQYLENVDRHSLASLEINKFTDLKTNQKYSSKELILLMKLELLRESIEESLTEEGSLDEVLQSVRTHLLPQCEKRHYLEKSCWKLIRRLCQLALPLSHGVTGHPLEYRTVLDFYYFEACYSQWASSHHLSHFEQLVNLLYALIFKRIGNLYIIFKVYPDLIYELTSFYKTLLQSLKFSRNEARDQAQLQKLVNICPNFVALVCEFYQTLRNSAGKMMVDEKEQESPQSIILSLLQEVFCATRKQLYREVFISPEVYLQKLYLSAREPQPIDTAIDIFRISSHPSPHSHPLPQVHPPVSQEPEEIKSQQEEMQMDEESEKEAMLQEEARDMMEGIEEGESSNEMQVEKQGQQKCRRIHTSLNNNLLPPGTKLTFTYYQFSFQMASALFTLDNHITPQNAVFYIGFLFNLLRILEMNLDPVRDAAYLKDFFRAVHSRIYSQKHSVLYLVLNYFFEPNYGQGLFKREIKPSQSKLCTEFVKYMQDESVSATSLLLNFEVGKTFSTVSLGQAMKFVAFQIENHLYQLKFLGNLYFNAKLITGTQLPHSEAFKYYILAGVVRHGLRVLKNIMYFQGWQGELEDARVEVGFQNLTANPAEGLKILVGCSKNNPEIFIKKLNEDSRKIEILETLLETQKSESTRIIEMLTTYYSS